MIRPLPFPQKLPCRDQKPYIPPQRKGARAMTIVAGFRCTDGIVVCADQQISLPGFHKYHEAKISREADQEWTSILFAYSGLPGLAREAQEKMVRALRPHRAKITSALVGDVADEVLTGMGRQYAELELQLLIGTSAYLERPELLKFDGKSLHTADNFNVLGAGDSSLTRFLSDKMYSPEIDVENGQMLGVYLIKKATEYVDHCGGPIDVAVLENYSGSVRYLSEPDIEMMLKKMESRETFLNQIIIRGDFSST